MLGVKWQRKLGAPKPGETFYSSYERAIALELREKQVQIRYRLVIIKS